MLASSSRLDLGITVGPEKPDHIKTILSGLMPIFIDYRDFYGDVTASALWRMRATLRHHDRVREIAFEGSSANCDKFFKGTKGAFPVLESLAFHFGCGYESKVSEIKLPDAFLGPDPSDPPLRRLTLEYVSLASISRFKLSATALTDLVLKIDTTFGPSPETSLLGCLQGMPCLQSLYLSILSITPDSSSQPSIPKDIVPLSKLTRFHYDGKRIFLNALSEVSAPSLQDVDIQFRDMIWSPIVYYLPRLINEIEERYYAVHVTFQKSACHLSLMTQSEYISHSKARFNLGSRYRSKDATIPMTGALSARLSTVEELRVTFGEFSYDPGHFIPWRTFFQQFPCVKALRTEGAGDAWIARILLQCHDSTFLLALDELELGKDSNIRSVEKEGIRTRSRRSALLAQERLPRARMAAIQPFISARQQVGRLVKVSFMW
jgi:hypothetical protein